MVRDLLHLMGTRTGLGIVAASVLIVLSVCCVSFAVRIWQHVSYDIAWHEESKGWFNTRGANGKVEEWGPLFENLRPTKKRYLHYVGAALPLQLLRSLVIGLLYALTLTHQLSHFDN